MSPKEKGMLFYNQSPVIKSRELNTVTYSLYSSSAGLPWHVLDSTSPWYRAQVWATCSSLSNLHLQNSCWVFLSFSRCLQFYRDGTVSVVSTCLPPGDANLDGARPLWCSPPSPLTGDSFPYSQRSTLRPHPCPDSHQPLQPHLESTDDSPSSQS